MHLFKPSIEGTYKPTLFNLSINKKNVLDASNRIKDDYGNIFFHEYIHYLQDVVTSFGLRNIAKLVREFSVVNHEIIALPTPTFNIPFRSSNPNLHLEAELFNLIWGTLELDNDDRAFEVINIEHHDYTFNPSLTGRKLVSVNILYRDNSENDAFYLGAIHFMEGIAYILERNFDPSQNPVPYPYTVVEKITKAVFETGDFTDRNLILIMEAALETHDPANHYFSFYQFCEHYKLGFTEETIKSFKDQHKLTWDKSVYKYDTFYYSNASLAKEAFKALFNHERLMSLNAWGKTLLSNAIKIRRSGFSFTDLLAVSGDTKKVKDKMAWLIKRLGTPIMSDGSHGIFLSSPDKKIPEDEMIYLLGLEAVLEILNGHTTCPIVPFCAFGQHGVNITDHRCFTNPWDRTTSEPLCLFAQLWIMWGFVQKQPTPYS